MADELKRLTLNDPVGKETLDKLAELENTEVNASLQLMAVMQEQVKLLAVGRRIDEERRKIFERILMDRGLPPQTGMQIDPTTGKITIEPLPAQNPT